jgi:DNA mismatch repair protein MutS
MPREIIDRAESILRQLERHNSQEGERPAVEATSADGVQLSFFQLDQVRDALLGLDINRLTPIEALTKLNDLRSIITAR